MDTLHLKAFLKIAETGSISRAAESLGIAQPSLSQQLLRLEDEVGVRLFDRTARGVVMTEAGKIFLERAHQILHLSDQAIADAQTLRTETQGQVVFAMPPSVARVIGARLVNALAQRAPNVHVRVVEAFHGTIRGWLESEKIDLGILYDLGPLRHLSARHLGKDELVLIAPRGTLQKPEIAFADLSERSIIAPGPQHGLRQLIEQHAAKAGCVLKVVDEIDAIDTSIELVADGKGAAILPACAVIDCAWSGVIDIAHFADGGLWRSLNLTRNPSHVMSHASVIVGDETKSIADALTAERNWRTGERR